MSQLDGGAGDQPIRAGSSPCHARGGARRPQRRVEWRERRPRGLGGGGRVRGFARGGRDPGRDAVPRVDPIGLLFAAQLGQRLGLERGLRIERDASGRQPAVPVTPVFAGLAVGRILPGVAFAVANTLGVVWAERAGAAFAWSGSSGRRSSSGSRLHSWEAAWPTSGSTGGSAS